MAEMTLEDRFAGCLVGLAVGDALGGPVEEGSRMKDPPEQVSEMTGGGWLKLRPGQITDDTEMALCIARSIAEKKGFFPEDIAERFVKWFYDNPIGAGATTRAAIENLKKGTPWNSAGNTDQGLNRTGNGSVMRCAPVALFYHKNLDKLVYESRTQSLITHPHPDCMDSSVFVNYLIAEVLNGKSKLEAYDSAFQAISMNKALQERYADINDGSLKKRSGEVKDTVESSLYCFLYTDHFEKAVLKAVNAGGDADTRGAVAGAMAGSYYGEKAIPERWKNVLVDRHGNSIYKELIGLSREIYDVASKIIPLQPVPEAVGVSRQAV